MPLRILRSKIGLQVAAWATVAALAAAAGAWWHGYRTGKVAERQTQEVRYQRAQDAARAEQERLADALEVARNTREVVYRDRIQTIREVVDPSGCADLLIPDSVRDALTTRGATR